MKLKDKYLGKSLGEWLHYPIVLFFTLFLGNLIQNQYLIKFPFNYLVLLIIFIISDTIAEKLLIEGKW